MKDKIEKYLTSVGEGYGGDRQDRGLIYVLALIAQSIVYLADTIKESKEKSK